jgi:quercetin dioxygenase-like cupin family protein
MVIQFPLKSILLVIAGIMLGISLSLILHERSCEKQMESNSTKLKFSPTGMKVTRLYTDKDGKSHFEEKAFELSKTEIGKLTDPLAVNTLFFGETGNVKEVSWHNPSRPCFVIMLEGAMEIEIGDGSKRIFKQGDILLAEDTSGQGHITRVASPGKGRYLMVTLE